MTRDLVSLLTMILVIGYSWAAAHADTVTLLRQAAHRYEVPNSLLLAIAYVESKGVLTALNIDSTAVFPLGSGQVSLRPPAQIPAQHEGRQA